MSKRDMENAEDFVVGEHYSASDIWNMLKVPKKRRTPEWQNTIYDFLGTYYVLCQTYNRREGIFSECKRHLGEIHCYGKPGVTLQLGMASALVSDKRTVHLFFRRSEQHDYVYLGTGKFRAFDDGLTSLLFISWKIDNGDNLLPLREHIDAFRRFCASYISDNVWIPDKSGDNLTLELLLDQLAISSAIEEVEVNTCRFGDGTRWDSGILEYEAKRSDLLSSTMSTLLSFTYSWMALETMLSLLPLPNVPRNLKDRAKLVDRCIYYLKLSLPGPYNETLLPGYEATLEQFKKVASAIPRYSRHVGQFDLQPHMNRWGLGLGKVRNVRNKFIHGVLRMPEYREPDAEEPEDDALFELSGRITLFAMQLVLYAQIAERNILLTHSFGEHKEGECAAEAVRTLHIES
ncbi:MAG: hypothetical protein ABFD82_00410 [Syntrophaceae bacterium]